MANKRVDQPTGTETVGHEWDGIEELNTPLPRWWLWTFYLTIAWAIGYVVLYPAMPLLARGTEGVLGWTSRGQLAQEMSLADQSRRSVGEALAAIDITTLEGNPQLMQQAVAGGRAAFRVHCSQCHGSGAAGSQSLGYPNLNDDDWLWGGDLKAIETTLIHGIRQAGDDATRQGSCPRSTARSMPRSRARWPITCWRWAGGAEKLRPKTHRARRSSPTTAPPVTVRLARAVASWARRG